MRGCMGKGADEKRGWMGIGCGQEEGVDRKSGGWEEGKVNEKKGSVGREWTS